MQIMTTAARIAIPTDQIASFCRCYHIRTLSLFGSVLRDGFGKDSDRDVLVEFDAGKQPGLIGLAGMELELSPLFSGYKVEINTPHFPSPHFREKVLSSAEPVYDRPGRSRASASYARLRPRSNRPNPGQTDIAE
jgi:hypothetical protein